MLDRTRWAAIGAAVAVAITGGAVIPNAFATVSSGTRDVFVPIVPCRLMDTRSGTNNVGTRATPLAQGEAYTTSVVGANGRCNIPADADAVSLNVTSVDGTASSFLTVWPADAAQPSVSNLNWLAGAGATPNKVDVKLSASGKLSLFNNAGTVDVIVDVAGYYADHNFDDRYYTKAQVDAKVGADAPSAQSIVYNEWAMHFNPSMFENVSQVHDCVTLNAQPSLGYLPIDVPVGAHLISVDLLMFVGNNGDGITASLNRATPTTSASALYQPTAIASYQRGGENNQFFHIVLTPAATTIADTSSSFFVQVGNFNAFNFGFCQAVVSYNTNG